MPKGLNEPPNLDLPFGWEISTDFDGKVYYIDHNTKKTTWIDPRDKFTKPETFADCIGNELPIGWEESYDQQIGIYFINHNDQTTQLEDPRQEWKSMQEDMLREYLNSAQDTLEAKREIYDIKQQRLLLAQDEYNHLNALAASRTSLCSSSSSCSTKFDPDLLRADLALAKERVFRLKKELARIHNEMTYTQRGVETLYSVEKKLNSHQNGCYNLSEAQAIMEEVRKIQKSLISGEREKKELMKSLAQVKDDLTRLQLRQESPDTSTFNLAQDRICSAASQTDLCSENFPIGAREMAKLRLNYDEWRKRVKEIQEKLAALEERIQPGEVESDQDRLLLFQEKKQLLLEYRSIAPKSRSKQENQRIQQICKKLESDLNNAYEESNQCIATRLKVHEEKQMLLQQLLDALREVTHLEKQLKSVSASTLSISSGSSLGSLSTASSKGSLSGLSFTDIYGDPLTVDQHVDMVDVNRRVQRLLHPSSEVSLSPRSSLSCGETPPASPLKLEAINEPMYENMQNLEISTTTAALQAALQQQQQQLQPQEFHQSSTAASILEFVRDMHDIKMKQQSLAPPLSPIYEKPSLLDIPQAALSRSSSASNTRSVSDESVAGDSGVFEASRALLQNRDTAQVQIGLKYWKDDSVLIVIVERARNLSALACLPENCQLYIKVTLLPGSAQQQTTIRTNLVSEFLKPIFGDSFTVKMPLSSIYSKSLHISVVSVIGQKEEWVGITQISLAEFNTDEPSRKWYNILSTANLDAPLAGNSSTSNANATEAMPCNFKEESSDESTIISSQTSTLTRNQGQDDMQAVLAMNLDHLNIVASDEEDDDEDDIEEEDQEHVLSMHGMEAGAMCGAIDLDDLDDDIEHHHETTEQMIAAYMNEMKAEMADKETNTECAFLPERARNRLRNPAIETSKEADDRLVKRSQTFSPSAVGNKARYICRLNRSDSDSAMHFHTITPHPFRRNAVERRSLRYHNRVPRTTQKMHPCVPRTSLDLELDLKAQQTKLENLHDEITRLRDLKQRLELARDSKDTKIATWALENEEFKKLVETANTDTPEEKKMQKLLHRTSKEIYKLRKTKVTKGQPDMISFKEKIAFFTRKGLSVPEIPTDNTSTENLEKYLPLTPASSTNGDSYPSTSAAAPSYPSTPSPSYAVATSKPKGQEIATQSDDFSVDRHLGVEV